MIFLEAQWQYKTKTFFPSFTFTLRFVVPPCCRVTFQPGLNGKICVSFLRLHHAEISAVFSKTTNAKATNHIRFLGGLTIFKLTGILIFISSCLKGIKLPKGFKRKSIYEKNLTIYCLLHMVKSWFCTIRTARYIK